MAGHLLLSERLQRSSSAGDGCTSAVMIVILTTRRADFALLVTSLHASSLVNALDSTCCFVR